ncbi:MAG: YggT family protein [Candidatus Omnitrophota bacterium]
MFVIIYILEGLAVVVGMGLTILYWLILIRVLISWVSPDPRNPLVQFLRAATDPILEPFRQLLMPLTYKIRVDLSPILAFFLISFLRRELVSILLHLADTFK